MTAQQLDQLSQYFCKVSFAALLSLPDTEMPSLPFSAAPLVAALEASGRNPIRGGMGSPASRKFVAKVLGR